jgi:hypothetical protein
MSYNKVIIELEPHSVLPVREAPGARLSCLEGALWITETGNRNDFVLEQGQMHELGGDGEAVVQAMGAARITLESHGEARIF